MSDTTVDDRVVSLKFDNKQFEAEAKKTLSTLDNLDKKIKSQDAVKGLTELDKALDKTIKPLNNMGSAVDGIKMKFSAMQIVALRTLERITDSAIDTGKKLISSLSIDQVTSGWSKYEQKTANVQTLINSTGKSIEEINGYLAKLMWYSDETSFGFTDMTSALATMVTTGGDMDRLIPMIEGIGNAVAYAGKGAAEFSRVIFNLNQSYSRGSLTTQDFRSVELAGGSSKQLKEFLIQAAEEVGTIEKGAGVLRDWDSYLSDHLITSEAMEIAFSRFSKYTEAIKEAVDKGIYANATEAMEHMSVDGFEKVAVLAFESAQNAKSFTEAIEATKDAVSSSWMDIFNSIFGNFAQARNLWTDLTERLYEAFAIPIQEKAETIRTVMGMSESWLELSNMVEKTGMTMDYFRKAATYTARENGIAIDDMIAEYGTFEETLQEGWLSGEMLRKTFSNILDRARPLATAAANLGITIDELTEDQAKANGVTIEQIELLKTLQKEASMANTSVGSLLDKIANEQTGRQKLVNSFSNILDMVHSLRQAFKDAWSEVFPKKDVSFWFSVIDKIQSFTEKLKNTVEKNIDKIKNIFKGLISIVDIIKTIGSAIFSFVKTVTSGFSGAEDGIFSFAEAISNTITKFASWLRESDIINNILQPIARVFKEIIIYARRAVSLIGEFMRNSGFIDGFKNAISEIGKFLSKFFSEFNKLPVVQDIFNGIQDAMASFFAWVGPKMDKAAKSIHDFTESFSFETIGEKLKSALKGIKEFFSNLRVPDGVKDAWTSFLSGIRETAQTGLGALNDLLDSGVIGKLVKGLLQIAAAVAGIRLIWKMGDVADSFAGLVNAFKAIPNMFASINLVITNYANSIKYDNILKIGKAIALISASLIALSLVNKTDLWNAVGVLGVMTAAMASLLVLNTGMLAVGRAVDPAVGKIQITMGNFIGMAILMLALSHIVQDFAKQDTDQMVHGLIEMGVLILEMKVLAKIMTGAKLELADGSRLLVKTGSLFTMAIGLWTFGKVLESLADIRYDKILEGVISIGLVMTALWMISKPMDRLSSFKFTSSIGILIFAYALRALSDSLEYIAENGPTLEDIIYNIGQYATIIGLILSLAVLSNASGGKIKNLGVNVLAFAAGMVILAQGVESIAELPLGDLLKASAVLTALGLILALMVRISSVGDKKKSSFRGFVGSVVALGAVLLEMWMISSMDTEELLKGVLSISAVMLAYGAMMANIDRVKVKASAIIGTITTLGLVTVAILALSSIPWQKTIAICAGLSATMVALAASLRIVSKEQKSIPKGQVSGIAKFAAMTLALIPVGIAIGTLSVWMKNSGTSANTIIASVTALSLCVIATAEAFSILSKSTHDNYIEAGDIVKFALLTGDLLLVGLAIGKLSEWMTNSGVSSKTILTSTVALGAGINAVAAAMKILGSALKDDKITVKKIGDFLLATVAMASVGLSIGGLSHWMTNANVNKATMLTSITAMSLGVLAVAGVFDILSLGNSNNVSVGTILKFELLTLALIPVGVAIGALSHWMSDANVTESMILSSTAAMAIGILAIAGALDLIKVLGFGGGTTLLAVAIFDVATLLLGGLVALFGMLTDDGEYFRKGAETLKTIGEAIGGFFGGIVGGFVGAAAGKTLAGIGQGLSDFWNNGKAFFDGIKTFDDDTAKDIEIMAISLGIFSVDQVIAGIANLIDKSDSFSRMGKSLTDFWKNSEPFFTGIDTLKEGTINSAATLSKVILTLAASDLIEAIASFVGMGRVEQWTSFGTGLENLGKGIKALADETSGVTTESLKPALDAITQLSEAKSHFDRIGGIVQDIIGVRETWAQFGEGLSGLGQVLHSFSNMMLYGNDLPEQIAQPFDRVKMDFSGLDAGIEAIADLADAYDDLPRIEGVVQWFIGKKETWKQFGDGLGDLGKDLVEFGDYFIDYDTTGIYSGFDVIANLVSLNKDLNDSMVGVKDEADVWTRFYNAVATLNSPELLNDLYEFIQAMIQISAWSSHMGDDPEENFKHFKAFFDTMTYLASFLSSGDGLKFEEKMEGFGKGIGYVTDGLQNFYGMVYGKNIMGIPTVEKGIDLNKLSSAVSIMQSIMSVVTQFDESIISDSNKKSEELAQASLNMREAFANFQWEDSIDFDLIEKTLSDFTKGFEHLKSQDFWDESVEAVEAVGAKFVEYVGIGMKGAYLTYIVPAFRTIVDAATLAMGRDDTTQVAPTNEYVKKFKIVGEHFAYGLRYGMNSKTGEIVKSVENMSETMVNALEQKLRIASPSKVTKEIGKYFDEGLAIGIEDNIDPAIESVEYLGDSIIYTFEEVEAETRSFGSSFEEFLSNPIDSVMKGIDWVKDAITGSNGLGAKLKAFVGSVGDTDIVSIVKDKLGIKLDSAGDLMNVNLSGDQIETLYSSVFDKYGNSLWEYTDDWGPKTVDVNDKLSKSFDDVGKSSKSAAKEIDVGVKKATENWYKTFSEELDKKAYKDISELEKTGNKIEALRVKEYKTVASNVTTYKAMIESMTDGLTEVVTTGAKSLRDSIVSDEGFMNAADWVYDMIDKEMSPDDRHINAIESFVNTAESLFIASDSYKTSQQSIVEKQKKIQENEAAISALMDQNTKSKEHMTEVTDKQTSAYDKEISTSKKARKELKALAKEQIKIAEEEQAKYDKESLEYKAWAEVISDANKLLNDEVSGWNNHISQQQQERANDILDTETSIVDVEEEIGKLLAENLQLSEEINEISGSMFDGSWDALVAYRQQFYEIARQATDIMSIALGAGPDLFKEIAETTIDSVKLPEEMYGIMQDNLDAYEKFYEALDKLRERGYNDAFINDMKETGYENYAQIMLYADATDNIIAGVNSAYESLNKLKFDEFTNNWESAMNKVRKLQEYWAILGTHKLEPEIMKAFKSAGIASFDLVEMLVGDGEHIDERIKELNGLFDESMGLNSEFANNMAALFSLLGVELSDEFIKSLEEENEDGEKDVLASMILDQASKNKLATEWSNYGEIISNNFIESMKPLETYLNSLKVKMTMLRDEALLISGISSTPVASYATPVTNSNGEVVSGVTYADQRYVYSTDKGGYFDPLAYSSKGTVNNNNTTNNVTVNNQITVEGTSDPETTGYKLLDILDGGMFDKNARQERSWETPVLSATRS